MATATDSANSVEVGSVGLSRAVAGSGRALDESCVRLVVCVECVRRSVRERVQMAPCRHLDGYRPSRWWFALTFIVGGRLQDKLGPFKISHWALISVSLGFFLCAYADSVTKFFIFFGVLGGLGNGFGYATPIPVMSKWFPDKRGLAVGLAVGGYGGGSAIFGPLAASYRTPHFGWRFTFQEVLGVTSL